MELQFKEQSLRCLEPVLQEVQSGEQTREIRLSDGMPDIGRIVSAWGQPIFRGKEWHSDSLTFTAGMMIWVLYAPEDGSAERVITDWIPFRFTWDLPQDTPEGILRIQSLPKTVDARPVTPRKMMVRCSVSALAEAFVPVERSVRTAPGSTEGMELRQERYPVRLGKEAGEKTFLLDEELSWPENAGEEAELVSCCLEPRLQEGRVLTDKLVYRGTGRLHVLCRSGSGDYRSRDFEIPFSGIAQLEGSYSGDARGEMRFGVTSLEPELLENGSLRVKCGVVGQYLITDREMLEVVEDAYSPGYALELQQENLEIPTLLETRREILTAQQTLPADLESVTDLQLKPDFPRQRRTEEGFQITQPAVFQVLYRDRDGQLHGNTLRWEGECRLQAAPETELLAVPGAVDPQVAAGEGGPGVRAELPLEVTSGVRQQLPMVTGIRQGQAIAPDPGRPSLVLQRAGGERLWDIARKNGSTVEAIRSANGLTEEPEPGRMLLIPVL